LQKGGLVTLGFLVLTSIVSAGGEEARGETERVGEVEDRLRGGEHIEVRITKRQNQHLMIKEIQIICLV
jgi:hypothetical protein